MSTAAINKKQREYNNKMTIEKCWEWYDNGGIYNPVTKNYGVNKDAVEPASAMNVILSNACATKGVFMENNPYKPPSSISVAPVARPDQSTVVASTLPTDSTGVTKKLPLNSLTQKSIFKNHSTKINTLNDMLDFKPNSTYSELKSILEYLIDFENIGIPCEPYYDNHICDTWIDIMKNSNYVENDIFHNIVSKKDVIIYTNQNYYFKTILYAFIYGDNLKIPALQKEIPQKFIKLLVNIFKKYDYKDYDNFLKDFSYIRYNRSLYYYQYNTDIIGNRAEIYYKNSRENIKYYIEKILLKYNRPFKRQLFLTDIQKFNYNSQSSNSEENIPSSCFKTINNITNPNFQNFKEKMLKTCKKYSKIYKYDETDMNENINENKLTLHSICLKYETLISRKYQVFLRDLYNSQRIFDNNDMIEENYNQNNTITYKIVLKNINKEYPLKSLFKSWYFHNYLSNRPINILNLSRSEFRISLEGYQGVASDVGGVTKEIMNDISHELFEKNVFIKAKLDISYDDSNKYFLNPHLDLKKDLDFDDDMNHIDIFCKFLGNLILFFLIHKFKLQHSLSSYILSGFLNYNPIDETVKEDYVYFMIRDFNSLSNMLINTLNYGDENSDTGFTLDSIIKLSSRKYMFDKTTNVDQDHNITNKDIEKYIYDLSKNIYLYNPVNSNHDVIINQHMKHLFDSLNYDQKNGTIPYIQPIFKKMKININTIDDRLTVPKINETIIGEFVNNILKHTSYETESHHSLINEIKEKLFFRLLEEHSKGNDFVEKLFKFMSGYNYYNDSLKYIIKINDKLDIKSLPKASTCFNTIVIPLYNNFDDFLEKLYQSVEYSYNNMNMLGGKPRNRNVKKTSVKKEKVKVRRQTKKTNT